MREEDWTSQHILSFGKSLTKQTGLNLGKVEEKAHKLCKMKRDFQLFRTEEAQYNIRYSKKILYSEAILEKILNLNNQKHLLPKISNKFQIDPIRTSKQSQRLNKE